MLVHLNSILKKIVIIILITTASFSALSEEKKIDFLKTNWSFNGIFGTFDRTSLQRGYQVYQEVCSGCHSVQYLSYRNLSEKGGPEFSIDESKAIASQFEVEDGPNSDGEMFMRTVRLSDNFVKPYPNVEASTAANGGAYPPDMSVLAKARTGGADYIYSLLLGYEDAPEGFELDDGVYYNKYMPGNKIKMSEPIIDGIVEYSDGTEATKEQIAKDITTFLVWSSEPHLESQHKMGFKTIIYLIILITLVYMSKQKVWSRFNSKKEEEENFDKVERVITEYEGEDPKTFK
ncbi:MAG: ubiquinol-cytochrome c reductase cytochrome c1 subunit [Pelagibacterales bacterium]|nr:ubiquinol-cytochrome c reductase cytochrome c1 subunit [Pelagibacterales bacterium]